MLYLHLVYLVLPCWIHDFKIFLYDGGLAVKRLNPCSGLITYFQMCISEERLSGIITDIAKLGHIVERDIRHLRLGPEQPKHRIYVVFQSLYALAPRHVSDIASLLHPEYPFRFAFLLLTDHISDDLKNRCGIIGYDIAGPGYSILYIISYTGQSCKDRSRSPDIYSRYFLYSQIRIIVHYFPSASCVLEEVMFI